MSSEGAWPRPSQAEVDRRLYWDFENYYRDAGTWTSTGGQHIPIGESYLSQIDPKQIAIIESRPETRDYILVINHLARTMYLTKTNAEKKWIRIRSLVMEDKRRYRGRPDLIRIFNFILEVCFDIVFGDALEGRRQRFVGVHTRRVELIGTPNENKKGIMDRLLRR